MRIDNTTPLSGSNPQASQLRRRDEGGVPQGAPPPHNSRVAKTEFGRIVNQARESAEIRTEVVESVKQRLSAGDYLTHKAAAGAIDALLAEAG